MKDLYSQYIDDDLWLIKETTFDKSLQSVRESQFSLGNGYLGVRGVLEEIPIDSKPGTYLAGVFDKLGSQVTELVNFPNCFNFRFAMHGEKLGLVAMDIIDHKRVLNLKKGLLARHTLYQTSKGKRFDYQSVRFVSMDNKNIGVMRIALTPLDENCILDISTGIDTSVHNTGTLSEGNKKHFRIKELGTEEHSGYLLLNTFDKQHTVIIRSGFYYSLGKQKSFSSDPAFQISLKKGKTIVVTKIFYIEHFPFSQDTASIKASCLKKFRRYFRIKFETLVSGHIKAWERHWERSDIQIQGTSNLQQNMRFNIYHMLICGHDNNGFSSIGARTLSGEGYRGHVFWDTEIFLLPFFIYTDPQIARSILLYRYYRLNTSRENAKREGYRGAKFAWESADTGIDETPTWAKDINGKIVKIHTKHQEIHITADIAYSVYKYYVATQDEGFMKNFGYEMIFEAARFWSSRAEPNKKKKCYEIHNVIGPDEFHVGVSNNTFTNTMAKWTLATAAKLYAQLRKSSPKTFRQLQINIQLSDDEARKWREIATNMKGLNYNRSHVIEQHDGYFKLKYVPIKKTDENGIPILPENLSTKVIGKTQFVKQADIVMLINLLGDMFSIKTKCINYEYYLQRTVHKSSLSASAYSRLACEVGDLRNAYNLFNVSLRADISNLYGNTNEGIHAASLGGTYQAMVFGFGGLAIKKTILCVNPRIPRTWNKLIFPFTWQQFRLRFELTNTHVSLEIKSAKKSRLKIEIFSKPYLLAPNKTYSFKSNEAKTR